MVQNVGQVRAQFIDGLHPQLFPQAISSVDPIDGEVVDQPHLVGLLQGESLRNALRFAVVRWIKPALLNFFLGFFLDKLVVLPFGCRSQGTCNCCIQRRG